MLEDAFVTCPAGILDWDKTLPLGNRSVNPRYLRLYDKDGNLIAQHRVTKNDGAEVMVTSGDCLKLNLELNFN